MTTTTPSPEAAQRAGLPYIKVSDLTPSQYSEIIRGAVYRAVSAGIVVGAIAVSIMWFALVVMVRILFG